MDLFDIFMVLAVVVMAGIMVALLLHVRSLTENIERLDLMSGRHDIWIDKLDNNVFSMNVDLGKHIAESNKRIERLELVNLIHIDPIKPTSNYAPDDEPDTDEE